MKAVKFLFLLIIPLGLSAQQPKAICDLSIASSSNDIYVLGTVDRYLHDDDFVLSEGNCQVICDGFEGQKPKLGSMVLVKGNLENTVLSVSYWVMHNEQPPAIPMYNVSNVSDALSSIDGTIAKISGSVKFYKNLAEGKAVVEDGAGLIDVNFSSNNLPSVNDAIDIIGVVEKEGKSAKTLDVIQWVSTGSSFVSPTERIHWGMNKVPSANDGDLFVVHGYVDQWVDKEARQATVNINDEIFDFTFDDAVASLPETNKHIHLLGMISEVKKQPGLKVYHWMEGLSIGQQEQDTEAVTLYPNPSRGRLFIDGIDASEVQVLNQTGQLVYRGTIEEGTLDLSHLDRGLYHVVFSKDQKRVGHQKVILM